MYLKAKNGDHTGAYYSIMGCNKASKSLMDTDIEAL